MGRRMPKSGEAFFASWLSLDLAWSRSSVRLITIGLVALALWLLASFVGQIILSAQMDRQRTQIAAEIALLQDENGQLATAVALAQSPDYADQVAREQLGYARDGDVIIVPVLPKEAAPPAPVATAVPVPAPKAAPNWQGWMRVFAAP